MELWCGSDPMMLKRAGKEHGHDNGEECKVKENVKITGKLYSAMDAKLDPI